MNIKKITEIVNDPLYTDDIKEHLIIAVLADDKNVIPTILDILAVEREKKRQLISDMNFQLSRAHCAIEVPKLNKEHFVEKEIIKFYHKNKEEVRHCFANMDNYPKPEINENTGFYED